MKKTIIASVIIFITVNLNAQTENDIFKYKGIVALFEKKIESVYDITKEEFTNEKEIEQRTLLFLSDKEILIENKKYKIQEKETSKQLDKSTNTYFDFVEYSCSSEDGAELIIEITKLENVVYGLRIYYWGPSKTLVKISFQH